MSRRCWIEVRSKAIDNNHTAGFANANKSTACFYTYDAIAEWTEKYGDGNLKANFRSNEYGVFILYSDSIHLVY